MTAARQGRLRHRSALRVPYPRRATCCRSRAGECRGCRQVLTAPLAAPLATPLLGRLAAALDEIGAHGPLSGSRTDTAVLLQLADRARGLALREVGQVERTGGQHVQGAPASTTASWLRDERLVTDGAARAAVRLAVELRDDLPAVGELLQSGQITLEHASAVAGGVRGLDRDVVTAAEQGLCALAQTDDPTGIRRRLRDMAHAVDDRLGAEAARRAAARQGLRISEVGSHTALDGTLAGEQGATVRLAMALAVQTARTHNDGTHTGGTHTGGTHGKAARQADVLIQWATDYLQAHSAGDSLAGDAHTVRSRLLITCTPEQLAAHEQQSDAVTPSLAELLARDAAAHAAYRPGFSATIVGDHNPLSRGALRRLACDATLTLIARADPHAHTCGHTGRGTASGALCEHLTQPLYVGRSTRTVSGQQFTALVVRDRTCAVKGCGRPPAQCQAHHVLHWADGGTTDLDNLVLLCEQHHHDHHDRGHNLPHSDGQRWLTQTGWARGPT